MPSQQGRHWAFNYLCGEPPKYDLETMDRLIYQKERAPTTGSLHWQCFVSFKKRVTLFHCKEVFGKTIHFDLCKGSYADNYNYCTKTESQVDPPVFFGDCPSPPKKPVNHSNDVWLFASREAGKPDFIMTLSQHKATYGLPATLAYSIKRLYTDGNLGNLGSSGLEGTAYSPEHVAVSEASSYDSR